MCSNKFRQWPLFSRSGYGKGVGVIVGDLQGFDFINQASRLAYHVAIFLIDGSRAVLSSVNTGSKDPL